MTIRKVIVELNYNRDLAASAFSAIPDSEKGLDTGATPKIAGVSFDELFAATNLPGTSTRSTTEAPYISGLGLEMTLDKNGEIDQKKSTYIVRADVDEKKLDVLQEHKDVVGVYSDIVIEPCITCAGSDPVGSDGDVERLLCTSSMHRSGMDGRGVLVAIVDSGINLAHMQARGKNITIDVRRSWVPQAGMIAGQAPVGHGTMCAYDAAIAAPRATYLDIQLLRSTRGGGSIMDGVLSDAVRAYRHLLGVMSEPRRIGDNRSLVVNNSWGMFHPSWDFPAGHPGNYSDNPNHPFNRIVGTLEASGADILFAAGNCGEDCPDNRCGGVSNNAIYGANGHPRVLCVAGVDINKERVGYSSQGPGRLSTNKPDLSGYTHFSGSGVYPADGGTSAATPVVAGVVAAVRSKRPYAPGRAGASPSAIRALMRATATDLGTHGYDFDHGYGVVGGCALKRKFVPPIKNICQRYPGLCHPRPLPPIKELDICKRYPWLCIDLPPHPRPPWPWPGPRPMPFPEPGPMPVPRPGPFPGPDPVPWERRIGASEELSEGFEEGDIDAIVQSAWRHGLEEGMQMSAPSAGAAKGKGDCGCKE